MKQGTPQCFITIGAGVAPPMLGGPDQGWGYSVYDYCDNYDEVKAWAVDSQAQAVRQATAGRRQIHARLAHRKGGSHQRGDVGPDMLPVARRGPFQEIRGTGGRRIRGQRVVKLPPELLPVFGAMRGTTELAIPQ